MLSLMPLFAVTSLFEATDVLNLRAEGNSNPSLLILGKARVPPKKNDQKNVVKTESDCLKKNSIDIFLNFSSAAS
jgi:hypothetical protein